MKEREMQTMFGNYLKANPPTRAEAYELKIVKGNALPFNAVKPHQIKGLTEANEGLYHKIADSPFFTGSSKMRFTKPKPFDCMYLIKAKAFIVILFYKPRQTKKTYLISLEKFIECEHFAERKSLTEERAKEIAERIIILTS